MSEDSQFPAFVADETGVSLRELRLSDLPAGKVLVKVAYSTLNYKDGLGITGKGKIYRTSPIVPGIDLAGTVVESADPAYQPGDAVIATGWGLGERFWGGYSHYARLDPSWLVPLPAGLSLRHAMALGTAGFTAVLCVLALEQAGIVAEREVCVSGAAGGVGSVAVALLAKAGHRVVAATGRPEEAEYLHQLGAQAIIGRDELSGLSRPLEKERWGGAVDTVGGATLSGLIRSMAYHAPIAACGNAGGIEFSSSVFPFILRAVKLIGVESVIVPYAERVAAWARLQRDLDPALLDAMSREIDLADLPAAAEEITNGQVRGRIVVRVAP